ncbi:hypothetical protein [Prosthecobacter sp.]|uniref:hypothetical protein n=1 Tax=Prosthecobacter sp. TaxID=1965333 RepID=UPI003783B80A
MKRILLIAALVLQSVSVWSLPQGGGFFNIGKDEDGTTLEDWFRVDSHWSPTAVLPGTWSDVQGSPNIKQNPVAGNVFGVPATRAMVERNAQGVITAVIAEFDATKQDGGPAGLARRLTTSIGVYQGNTSWTTQFNDKVNVGKELIVTLHQQGSLVSVRLTRAHS